MLACTYVNPPASGTAESVAYGFGYITILIEDRVTANNRRVQHSQCIIFSSLFELTSYAFSFIPVPTYPKPIKFENKPYHQLPEGFSVLSFAVSYGGSALTSIKNSQM